MSDNSAQVHTLEGFSAAFIVLFALLFGLQAIAITPTSSSTASQEVEQHNYIMVGDVLDTAKADGSLKEAVLRWEGPGYENSAEGAVFYTGRTTGVPGSFGDHLDILEEEGLAYNIEVICDGNVPPGQEPTFEPGWLVRNGEPTLNAVTARTTLQLRDDDRMANGDELGDASEGNEFLGGNCENVNENERLYNIVEVRITAWRQ